METHFGKGIEVFPVFNGTGANVTSLQAMLPRWGAVICSNAAHLATDESVAPQAVGHFGLLPVTSVHGKITPETIDEQAYGFGDEHHPQPAVVSIAQSTELGSVYTVVEVRAISDHARGYRMPRQAWGSRCGQSRVTSVWMCSALGAPKTVSWEQKRSLFSTRQLHRGSRTSPR